MIQVTEKCLYVTYFFRDVDSSLVVMIFDL